MKTITQVETHLDDLQFGFWDSDAEEFIPIKVGKESNIVEAAQKLGVSELMLDTLIMHTESIQDSLRADLIDIWERLDRLER